MNATACGLPPLSEAQVQATYGIRFVGALLSLLGCTYMILSVWLFRRYKFFSQRLVLWMSVAAGGTSVQWFLPSGLAENSFGCYFQAIWATFFDWALVTWICVIAFNTYVSVVRKKQDAWRWERKYHLAAWSVPFVMALLPLIGGQYGKAGEWCWIKENSDVWRLLVFYLWLLLLFIAICVAYVLIIRELRAMAAAGETEMYARDTGASADNRTKLGRSETRLKAYVLAFIVLWIPAIVNRISNWVCAGHPVFVLVLFHSFFVPLQGLVNTVIYCSSEEGMLTALRRPRDTWTLFVARVTGREVSRDGVQAMKLGDISDEEDDDDGAAAGDNKSSGGTASNVTGETTVKLEE